MAPIKKRSYSARDEQSVSTRSIKVQVVTKTSRERSGVSDDRHFTALPVRPLLADLKSGQLSRKSISERLHALSDISFPRQEEWTLTYLLNVLAKERQDYTELEVTWLALVNFMDRISAARLQILFRRFDLVFLLTSYLNADSKAESPDSLRRILCMIQKLQTNRETRRLMTTTFERACGAVLACSQLLLKHTLELSLCEHVFEILFFNVKHQSSQKKLLEWMRSSGLMSIIALIDKFHHSSPEIDRLLRTTIFEESELVSTKSLKIALNSCVFGPGLEHLCSLSFACVDSEVKNQSKRLTIKNSLLEMWLSVSDAKHSAEILSLYQESHNDSNITRPLSSDSTITHSLQELIVNSMSRDSNNPAVVAILLELDLDLIIPKHEKTLWLYIDVCQDKQLLTVSMKAYIQIRSLPSFIVSLLSLSDKTRDIIDGPFLNAIANEVFKMTEAMQNEMVRSALRSDSKLKQTVLIGIVGGLSSESDVLRQNIRDLSSLQSNAELSRLIALRLKSHFVNGALDTNERFDNSATLEVSLRQKELDIIDGSTTIINSENSANIMKTLMASDDSKVLQASIERWLPTLVPLLDSSQRADFILLIAHKSIGSVMTDNLLCSRTLLENIDLHSSLQDYFLSILDSTDLSVLEYIPVEFFHKAVRKQIVSRLMSREIYGVTEYKVLLKYARAGILPSFKNANDYAQFANKSLACSEASSDPAIESLRRFYIRSLEEEQCQELIQLPSSATLKIEIIEEKFVLEKLLTIGVALVDDCIASLQYVGESSEAKYKTALVLLRLCKAFGKVPVQDRPELHALTRISRQEWSEIVKSASDPRVSLLVCEIAAWQAQTVASAMEVIEMVKLTQGEKSILTTHVLSSFADTLPLEVLYSLLDQTNTNVRNLERPEYIALLSCVIQPRARTAQLSPSWIHQQFDRLCETTTQALAQEEFETVSVVLQTILETHARTLDITSIDRVCLAMIAYISNPLNEINVSQTTRVHRVLRAMFQHHAYRLKDRYHIVILLFQKLLMLSLRTSKENTKESANSYVRLFETFLNSSRALSMTPEQFNKAFAKHVPWLLIEYIHALTHGTDQIFTQAKTIIEENLVYECMSLCGQHEREMIGASLDSAGRGLFKRLYDEWSKFGKWTER